MNYLTVLLDRRYNAIKNYFLGVGRGNRVHRGLVTYATAGR